MHVAELLESPALDLLLTMERDELQIEATDADVLRISPAARLDADRLALVRRYKPELLQLIRMCDDGVQARLFSYREDLTAASAPQIPEFLFRADVPYQAGVCFSCGDRLPPADVRTVTCERTDGTSVDVTLTSRYGRCWRCAFAFRLAIGAELPSLITHARDEAKLLS